MSGADKSVLDIPDIAMDTIPASQACDREIRSAGISRKGVYSHSMELQAHGGSELLELHPKGRELLKLDLA